MSFDFSFPPQLEELRIHARSVATKGAIEFGRLMIHGSMATHGVFPRF